MRNSMNSECYPYDNLNLNFDKNRCATCTRVSARATTDTSISSLTFTTFLHNGPFVIIDCSRQNESVKSDTVDD